MFYAVSVIITLQKVYWYEV